MDTKMLKEGAKKTAATVHLNDRILTGPKLINRTKNPSEKRNGNKMVDSLSETKEYPNSYDERIRRARKYVPTKRMIELSKPNIRGPDPKKKDKNIDFAGNVINRKSWIVVKFEDGLKEYAHVPQLWFKLFKTSPEKLSNKGKCWYPYTETQNPNGKISFNKYEVDLIVLNCWDPCIKSGTWRKAEMMTESTKRLKSAESLAKTWSGNINVPHKSFSERTRRSSIEHAKSTTRASTKINPTKNTNILQSAVAPKFSNDIDLEDMELDANIKSSETASLVRPSVRMSMLKNFIAPHPTSNSDCESACSSANPESVRGISGNPFTPTTPPDLLSNRGGFKQPVPGVEAHGHYRTTRVISSQ